MIHGDIKPSNIQIAAAKDEVRLLDFGISKNISATQNLTRHNMGSPSYCSPERLLRGQVDVNSDLWAVGVTLFEMLAGMPPYQAQDTRAIREYHSVQASAARSARRLSSAFESHRRQSARGDLELRYHSAQEFENDLRAYFGEPTGDSDPR